MSTQERRSIILAILTIVLFVVYYKIVLDFYSKGTYSTTEEFQFWGLAILLVIPGLFEVRRFLYFIYSALYSLITQRREDDFMTGTALQDEYNRLIKAKALRNFYHAFMGSFVLAMGVLSWGGSPLIMFNILLFGVLIAHITYQLSEFYYLRQGV